MSDHTVLVLGAGASLPYGLPLGKGLVERICEILPSNDKNRMSESAMVLYNALVINREFIDSWRSVSTRDPVHALMEFRQRLVESDPKSIDEFLSRDFKDANTAFQLIGKLSIAYVISSNETIFTSKYGFGPENDNWYRYLWQDCLNNGCKSYDDVKTKKLRIISFNYDRSLEYFLGRRLAATYFSSPGTPMSEEFIGRWGKEGFDSIESPDFKITHPYGKLGSLTSIPYGESNNFRYYGMVMATNIKVIGEDRSKDDSFKEAKEWLRTAKKVVFLGFSFDKTNMDRLGLAKGLSYSIEMNQQAPYRTVNPMSYGFELTERRTLINEYFREFIGSDGSAALQESSYDSSAPIIQYLRRHGGLTGL